jgi:hypothetical protein
MMAPVDDDRKAKLRRRCDLLFYASALVLAMIVLTVPPDTAWIRYAVGSAWFAMVALLIIPRW